MSEPVAMDAPIEIEIDETTRGIAARSNSYRLFSQAFVFPMGDLLTALLNGSLRDALLECAKDLPYACHYSSAEADYPTPNSRDAVSQSFTSLFDNCTGRPRVSVLERRHVRSTEQTLWEDLLRFYNHFGLDFSQGGANEPPDHLNLELEYMHYLSFLEAGAPQDRTPFQLGQHDFMERHLGVWSGAFADSVEAVEEDNQPYAMLARMLAEFAQADFEYLKGLKENLPETDQN
ncbi:MAG: molecular chaperone TorD family protein [Gammaproteobacteria bacterium]|nr:molecular chaperone TorD family protein [Gammaproteobacteria bacterium]